ncbi:putative Ig domain-containing protein [Kitasatospora sp. NPDC048540]|uniref:putative Ig domain-containing protein n=1 Tax=unclassified Kitasatospora TaxID=2633591 RepID=UPI000692308D|nr:putative Ig domain-containing protein [Kitasatospora sp. MBT63]
MGVSVTFEDGSDAVEVVPGEETACVLRVENTGMVVDQILLDVLGEAAQWASVEPARANLLPGAFERIRVTFRPPRAASLTPGELRFGLRAMSKEDPDGSCIEEGTVHVGEFGELGAQLVPKSSTGRRAARFKLVVENRGNRPERLRIETLDPDVKLGFRTRPAVFVARPGTATFVRVKTVPRKTFLRGPNRTLPFEVHAVPEQGQTTKTEGVMLEKQTLPEWLLPALAISIVAAGLLFALWINVLRPVVHSAATAASAAAHAQDAADSAQSAAAGAGDKQKESPKPAPPTALALKLASPTLVTGASDLATVTGTFTSGSGPLPKLVWTSSAPRVATVSQSGQVTALSPGSATITATSATATASPAATNAPAPPKASDGAAQSPAADPSGPPVLSGSVMVTVVGPVSVSTTDLPQAALGKPYTHTLAGAGGTAPYTWTISTGALPPGLSLAPGTGVISGTPTAAGTASLTVHLADAGPPSQSATRAVKLTVLSTLAVDSSSLPSATTGTAYTQTLAAVGGTAPYKWALAPGQGTLPSGLSLDATTGAISGAPTQAGSSDLTVEVTDSASPNQSATQHLSLTVAKPLLMSTLAIPDGVATAQYSQTLGASGGTGPYTWSVSAGKLPEGLTLGAATGTVSGTPQMNGSSTFTVLVTDAGAPARTTSQAFTTKVVTGFATTTSSLPAAAIGLGYSAQLTAAGGSPNYVWTPTGTLPPGLTLAPNGTITGTPTATGSFPFGVRATDTSTPPLTATESLTITVAGSLRITTTALPNALTGQQYSQTLTATGGRAPYTWSVTSANLPNGLSLNSSTGVLSGTPVQTGAVKLDISVTDSGPPLQNATLTIPLTVTQPLSFSMPVLPDAALGFPYPGVEPTGVNGGSGRYLWSVTQGALPPGFQLDASTGRISGTVPNLPSSTLGPRQFTLTVSDTTDYSVTANTVLTITVINPLTVQPADDWTGEIGKPFRTAIKPVGGKAPYTYEFTATTTPPANTLNGLTFAPAIGELSGIPDGPCSQPPAARADQPPTGTQKTVQITCAPDTYQGKVTVKDALGESVTTTLRLTATVVPLVVKFNTSAKQTAGEALSFKAVAAVPSGGYPGATFEYSATGLPCDTVDHDDCDVINPATGVITGTLDHLDGKTATVTVTVTSTDPANSQNKIIARSTVSVQTDPGPTPSPSATAGDTR